MSVLVKGVTKLEAGLGFVIDGGGVVITAGEQGHLEIPFDCEIQSVELLADQTGAIKVDIWADTYANFPPTNADTITGGNEPEITAGNQKYQDTTLTGWTKSLSKGRTIAFNVDSVTSIQRCTVTLKVNKT